MAEFTAAVENYDRFMGRYAAGLAPKFADAAGVRAGMRVLDVGCGPGALAVELAGRVGEDNVAAIDPAPSSPLPARHASQARTCARASSSRCPGTTAPSTRRCARWSWPG
jgi:ubiquinone/menaquinone biosynthesis C-methylase UbiE